MKRLPVTFFHVEKYDDGTFSVSMGTYSKEQLENKKTKHEASKVSTRRDGVTYNSVETDFKTFVDAKVKVEPSKDGGKDA
jgi:hypothetical protein